MQVDDLSSKMYGDNLPLALTGEFIAVNEARADESAIVRLLALLDQAVSALEAPQIMLKQQYRAAFLRRQPGVALQSPYEGNEITFIGHATV